MELVTTAEFLGCMKGVGIVRDDTPTWPQEWEDDEPDDEFLRLRFTSDEGGDRYWITGGLEPAQMLKCVATMVDLLDPWEEYWVSKVTGVWADKGESEGYELILRSLGIPENYDGALRFQRNEAPALILLIYATTRFGWCGYYDLWIVPDHGRQMIGTDDDDITAVYFADEESAARYVAAMEAVGFSLPESPPDSGFRWEPWMGPEPPGWGEALLPGEQELIEPDDGA